MKYNRILLKLSGESLAGEKKQGINAERLEYAITKRKPQIKVQRIVRGGGIFFAD